MVNQNKHYTKRINSWTINRTLQITKIIKFSNMKSDFIQKIIRCEQRQLLIHKPNITNKKHHFSCHEIWFFQIKICCEQLLFVILNPNHTNHKNYHLSCYEIRLCLQYQIIVSESDLVRYSFLLSDKKIEKVRLYNNHNFYAWIRFF